MAKTGIFLASFLIVSGCVARTTSNDDLIVKEINSKLTNGDLWQAFHLADSLRSSKVNGTELFMEADSMAQMAERTAIDFSVTEQEVRRQIEERKGPFSQSDFETWEKKGWLEFRIINRRKMYFNRAASNLVLISRFREKREDSQPESGKDTVVIFRLKHTSEVMQKSIDSSYPVVPVEMKITYTITVSPDAAPAGETIRCWLPWPRADQPRQTNIKLLSASESDFTISPDSAIHSTIYMEKTAHRDEPTVFQVSFSYWSKGQYFKPEEIISGPYKKNSGFFRRYTSVQSPQINFNEPVRHLADSIGGDEKDPKAIVSKIYLWFKENIPWTGALEYSLMSDIPAYVLNNRRGDCGMQTFLFMSMLRSKGIPVRWQSGWMVPPGAENLHDWCEVWYEGTGWVPADVSYDLQPSEKQDVRKFYMNGIDSYRMIVNKDVAGRLYPEKKYLRSEPYDFQRGEVEWKGGNLYFDKWDYDMKIEYIN
jgi:hypothetical protein